MINYETEDITIQVRKKTGEIIEEFTVPTYDSENCVTYPQPYKEYLDNPRYKIAFCECEVPSTMGIIIDTKFFKKKNNYYKFHCIKCGLDGYLFTKE